MNDHYWKLLTSIFIIVASLAVLYATIVLTGGAFTSIGAFLVIGGIAGILAGILKGVWTIVAYRRENRE